MSLQYLDDKQRCCQKKKNKKRNLLHSVVPLSRMLNVEHTAGESSVGLIWVIDRVESRWVGESVSCWALGLLGCWWGRWASEIIRKTKGKACHRDDATTRLLDSTFWPISVEMSCVLIVCARERERERDWHSVEMKVKSSRRDKRSTAWNLKLKPKDETETET